MKPQLLNRQHPPVAQIERRLLAELDRAAPAHVFGDDWQPQTVLARHGFSWIEGNDGTRFVLRAPVAHIAASIDYVWKFMSDPYLYANLCDKAFPIATEETRLKVLQGTVPSVAGNSTTIKVLRWAKKLPLSTQYAERLHVLVADGPSRTRSYIAVKVPGLHGHLTSRRHADAELTSLVAINRKLKEESEKSRWQLLKNFLDDLSFFVTRMNKVLWRLSSFIRLK